mmetsp:Transcript_18127/g.41295  ORF Transcript_18127/g.41295 Transcript_18127/m.41295 type:complete len:261 (+) Transcript_18127:2820-3602(+)
MGGLFACLGLEVSEDLLADKLGEYVIIYELVHVVVVSLVVAHGLELRELVLFGVNDDVLGPVVSAYVGAKFEALDSVQDIDFREDVEMGDAVNGQGLDKLGAVEAVHACPIYFGRVVRYTNLTISKLKGKKYFQLTPMIFDFVKKQPQLEPGDEVVEDVRPGVLHLRDNVLLVLHNYLSFDNVVEGGGHDGLVDHRQGGVDLLQNLVRALDLLFRPGTALRSRTGVQGGSELRRTTENLPMEHPVVEVHEEATPQHGQES